MTKNKRKGKAKKKKKTWQIKKQHIKYFHASDTESPQEFEDRVNKWLDSLHDYSIEFEWFFPDSGIYFLRYVQTHSKKSVKPPKSRRLLK